MSGFVIEMLRIGNLSLSSKCILAPLSGISDLPFRMINRSFGCQMAFTEMISASALVHDSGKTEKMLRTGSGDMPLGVQLVGGETYHIERAVEILNAREFALLDVNAACTARKVTGSGKGASLMKTPGQLKELLKCAVRNSRHPVTVKIRSGWDDDSVNARDVALHAQDAGISALFIHGRTKKQGYSGSVDYGVIRNVKESIGIPVIGSGDALSPKLIKKMFDETGCDGVVIARGSFGNPWIFKEAEAFLHNGLLIPRPGLKELTDTVSAHLNMVVDFYGERLGILVFRKFFGWYVKGLRHSKSLRDRAYRAVSKEEMTGLMEELRGIKFVGKQ